MGDSRRIATLAKTVIIEDIVRFSPE